MAENDNIPDQIPSGNDNEKPQMDFMRMFRELWNKRKKLYLWTGIGAVIGLVVAFSLPKTYVANAVLAPEYSSAGGTSSALTALASLAGVSAGTGQAMDAVYPILYPDIVHSIPFTLSLLDVKLHGEDSPEEFTLKEYMLNDMKGPWWGVITSLPGRVIGALTPKEETGPVDPNHKPDPFQLTQDEDDLVNWVAACIGVNVDAQTTVVTISVALQDPMVAALLADTVVNRLQSYVTDYRTNKARQDLEYVAKLNQEAKASYYEAQQKYANYRDSHQGLVMYSAQTMRDRLENETQLAFNLYNQTSQQLAMAQAKVQEVTPVWATLKPATVPVRAASPRKPLILVAFTFLGFLGSAAWILWIAPLKRRFKETAKETEAQ